RKPARKASGTDARGVAGKHGPAGTSLGGVGRAFRGGSGGVTLPEGDGSDDAGPVSPVTERAGVGMGRMPRRGGAMSSKGRNRQHRQPREPDHHQDQEHRRPSLLIAPLPVVLAPSMAAPLAYPSQAAKFSGECKETGGIADEARRRPFGVRFPAPRPCSEFPR